MHNNSSGEVRKPSAMTCFVYITVMATALFVGLYTAFSMGTAGMYSFVLLLYAALCFLLFRALLLLITGNTVLRITKITVNLLCIFFIIVGVWLGLGLVMDIIGVPCVGFFGVATSCLSEQFMVAAFLVFNPYVIVPVSLLGIIGLTRETREKLGRQRSSQGNMK